MCISTKVANKGNQLFLCGVELNPLLFLFCSFSLECVGADDEVEIISETVVSPSRRQRKRAREQEDEIQIISESSNPTKQQVAAMQTGSTPDTNSNHGMTATAAAPLTECVICYESVSSANTGRKKPVCTKCGHVFHKFCIETNMNTRKECPTCRVKINKKDLRALYL